MFRSTQPLRKVSIHNRVGDWLQVTFKEVEHPKLKTFLLKILKEIRDGGWFHSLELRLTKAFCSVFYSEKNVWIQATEEGRKRRRYNSSYRNSGFIFLKNVDN